MFFYCLVLFHLLCYSHVYSFIISNKFGNKIIQTHLQESKKGFGKPIETIKVTEEVDAGTKTYEIQSKRGVPEYNVFLRPFNGTETDWVPVGSMTIPRDVKINKAIYEVEEDLLKGTFKLFPKLKAYYEFRKDKDNVFEYGYVLKAFPDEPIQLIQREVEKKGNLFTNW